MKVGCIGFFDSMHLLPGHPKCGVPHGHTWKVEVVAEGPVVRGMVMDFADLKKAMKEVVAAFDHTDLNLLLPIPTCEYITFELLRRLKEPGLEIGSMFRRIAADVNDKTNGRQRPETYVSLIGEYYLNQKDKPVWDQIKDSSGNISDWCDQFHYWSRHPEGANFLYTDGSVQDLTHHRARRARAEQALRDRLQLGSGAQERPHQLRPFAAAQRQRRFRQPLARQQRFAISIIFRPIIC